MIVSYRSGTRPLRNTPSIAQRSRLHRRNCLFSKTTPQKQSQYVIKKYMPFQRGISASPRQHGNRAILNLYWSTLFDHSNYFPWDGPAAATVRTSRMSCGTCTCSSKTRNQMWRYPYSGCRARRPASFGQKGGGGKPRTYVTITGQWCVPRFTARFLCWNEANLCLRFLCVPPRGSRLETLSFSPLTYRQQNGVQCKRKDSNSSQAACHVHVGHSQWRPTPRARILKRTDTSRCHTSYTRASCSCRKSVLCRAPANHPRSAALARSSRVRCA